MSQPLDEKSTRRDDGDVEPFVDIAVVLLDVITVRIYEDRPITIYASAKKVGEVRVRDRQRAKREALRRRQADSTEPIIEVAITPGEAVVAIAAAVASSAMRFDWRDQAEAQPTCLEQIPVLRYDRDGHSSTPEVASRRDQADDVRDVG